MSGLLRPGAHRAAGVADDAAVLDALLRVEAAWAQALVVAGIATAEQAAAVDAETKRIEVDLPALVAAGEDAGNPVVPLVKQLRAAVGPDAAAAVHKGLTSQDVLDTALMLLAREAAARVRRDLVIAGQALAVLAEAHRGSVMAGRTLTQWAVPTTFGLKAAQWLGGIGAAVAALDALTLPVQYGGAAGTRALLDSLTGGADQAPVVAAFAETLGLAPAALPWHTRRHVVTALGDALATTTDALGVIAADVLLLGRPEIGEVREGAAPGRGGSSTMPHKRNPVLATLVSSTARQAPLLAAQLHLAAADAVDERPDGAWHAEWPTLATLLTLAVTAAAQGAELVAGLEVDTEAMAGRVSAAAEALLAEHGGDDAPEDYLGANDSLIDAALAAWTELS